MNTNEKTVTFAVTLAEEDIIRFYERSYADGTTPAAVIEGFVNDLVSGLHSNGSDERMLAQDYYERCGYGYTAPCTFVRYILRREDMDQIRTMLDEKEEELETFWESDDIGYSRAVIHGVDAEMDRIYQSYTQFAGKGAQSKEQAMQDLDAYLNELRRLGVER